MVPIIVSKERVVGPNRFTYALVDTANKPIASPQLVDDGSLLRSRRRPGDADDRGAGHVRVDRA